MPFGSTDIMILLQDNWWTGNDHKPIKVDNEANTHTYSNPIAEFCMAAIILVVKKVLRYLPEDVILVLLHTIFV